MMAVDAGWRSAVETMKFFDLRRDNTFEGVRESRMEQNWSKAIPSEIACNFLLTFNQPRGNVYRREQFRQVQMKAAIKTALLRQCRPPVGVCHKHHGAG